MFFLSWVYTSVEPKAMRRIPAVENLRHMRAKHGGHIQESSSSKHWACIKRKKDSPYWVNLLSRQVSIPTPPDTEGMRLHIRGSDIKVREWQMEDTVVTPEVWSVVLIFVGILKRFRLQVWCVASLDITLPRSRGTTQYLYKCITPLTA